MSGLSDFFPQPGFWWGTPFGAVVAGIVGPVITARSVRGNESRKAEREDRLSKQELIRESTTAYGEVCSAVLEKAIDAKGIFNAIRDAAVTTNRMPDEMELEKIEYATDLMDETKKLTTAYNNLRLVAPVPVMDKATALNAAIIALTKHTTSPLAKPPLMAAAGRAFDDFTNAVRAELDLDPYTPDDAARANAGYMETLQKQVKDYIAEAREDALKLGFIDLGSAEVVRDGSFEVRPPGSIGVTPIKARQLSDDQVGKFVGCHSPLGYNYGAKIMEIKRETEDIESPVRVRLLHPPSPVGHPAHEGWLQFEADEDLELVDLPTE